MVGFGKGCAMDGGSEVFKRLEGFSGLGYHWRKD
jgi:hypothetical protein